MIKLLFQLILAVIIFRIVGSLFGVFRGRREQPPRVGKQTGAQPVKNHEYEDLTPYDIEDADYEELPKRDR